MIERERKENDQAPPSSSSSFDLLSCSPAPFTRPTIAVLVEQGERLLELGDLLVGQLRRVGHRCSGWFSLSFDFASFAFVGCGASLILTLRVEGGLSLWMLVRAQGFVLSCGG